MGLSAGFGGRVALAFLQKNMDTSLKSSEKIDGCVKAPLLANAPRSNDPQQRVSSETKPSDGGFASIGVLTTGVILIHLFSKRCYRSIVNISV
ncbi:MAG: hypothetical protein ACREQ2_10700 [Candidatus Binatia bacterium]